jgi:hypothetical protein
MEPAEVRAARQRLAELGDDAHDIGRSRTYATDRALADAWTLAQSGDLGGQEPAAVTRARREVEEVGPFKEDIDRHPTARASQALVDVYDVAAAKRRLGI